MISFKDKVSQNGLELMASSASSASAFKVVDSTGIYHHKNDVISQYCFLVQPVFFIPIQNLVSAYTMFCL